MPAILITSMFLKKVSVVTQILLRRAGEGFLRRRNCSSKRVKSFISCIVHFPQYILCESQSMKLFKLLFFINVSQLLPVIEPKNTCLIQSSNVSLLFLHPPYESEANFVKKKLPFCSSFICLINFSSEE